MATMKISFELDRKQLRQMVQQFLAEATPEEVQWMFKSLTVQQRNTLNHLDMVKKYSRIVAAECLLPKNCLSDHVKPY